MLAIQNFVAAGLLNVKEIKRVCVTFSCDVNESLRISGPVERISVYSCVNVCKALNEATLACPRVE